MLISSHDINLIYQISEYVYILKEGNRLAEGQETEIFKQTNVVEEAGLTQAWLVKIHVNLGLFLFKRLFS